MSWILKQAEEILNRVDQQTNAALHQHNSNKTGQTGRKDHQIEVLTENQILSTAAVAVPPVIRPKEPIRLKKSTAESDLIEYLNSPAPSNLTMKKKSSPPAVALPLETQPIKETRNEKSLVEREEYQRTIETLQRQLRQYQQQITESDALLENLRARESDLNDILLAKDSQLTLLRSRLQESEMLLQSSQFQSDEHRRYQRLLDEQIRKNEELKEETSRLELDGNRREEENQRLKDLLQQNENELNEYKIKAQRILQSKEKLIQNLKELAQHRSQTPTLNEPVENETTISSDASALENHLQQQLKEEIALLKHQLEQRELTLQQFKDDLQESELHLQRVKEQSERQIEDLQKQLQSEQMRSAMLEHDLQTLNEDFRREKQLYQDQVIDRERELERVRSQLTTKTINQVNDEELERRVQSLTESILQKQTKIETLQMEKSSLTMQLERLEKRLEDYENIRTRNEASIMSIPIPDEQLRHRHPLLRETPYDVHLTKHVKRAANELDHLADCCTTFLRRYPLLRLILIFYVIFLHLWTFILLCTYTPEVHD